MNNITITVGIWHKDDYTPNDPFIFAMTGIMCTDFIRFLPETNNANYYCKTLNHNDDHWKTPVTQYRSTTNHHETKKSNITR